MNSLPVQRACRLAQFGRASWYRRSQTKDQSALRMRIRDLAHARPRFGSVRIWVLLRREGWEINRKRVRRLYRLDGLQLWMRVRRRKPIALHRGPARPGNLLTKRSKPGCKRRRISSSQRSSFWGGLIEAVCSS